jgi:hypothetical protein
MAVFYALLALSATAVAYIIWKVVYNTFLHPLAKIPGRKLAGISRLYEWYWDCVQPGLYSFEIMKMHSELG